MAVFNASAGKCYHSPRGARWNARVAQERKPRAVIGDLARLEQKAPASQGVGGAPAEQLTSAGTQLKKGGRRIASAATRGCAVWRNCVIIIKHANALSFSGPPVLQHAAGRIFEGLGGAGLDGARALVDPLLNIGLTPANGTGGQLNGCWKFTVLDRGIDGGLADPNALKHGA